jgi:hypothetical protein
LEWLPLAASRPCLQANRATRVEGHSPHGGLIVGLLRLLENDDVLPGEDADCLDEFEAEFWQASFFT